MPAWSATPCPATIRRPIPSIHRCNPGLVGNPGRPPDVVRYRPCISLSLAPTCSRCTGDERPVKRSVPRPPSLGVVVPVSPCATGPRPKAAARHLGIDSLLRAGGSLGVMQVLHSGSASYPHGCSQPCRFAAARATPRQNARSTNGRQRIMADPDWVSSDFIISPSAGVLSAVYAVARMAAHITYAFGVRRCTEIRAQPGGRHAVTYGFDPIPGRK